MKYLEKAFDHFRKLYRSGRKISLHETKTDYWLCDGHVLVRVPIDQMELNPLIFEKEDLSDVMSRNQGVSLKYLGLSKTAGGHCLVPYQGDGFTVWFNKKYLDIFSPHQVELYSDDAVTGAFVHIERCGYSGLIMPVRHCEELPTLFDS